MADRTETPLPLGRRIFRLRIASALTDRGSGLALGVVILVTAGAYVLGVRGMLSPTAWQAGLLAGAAFVLLRSLLRLFDRAEDPTMLREALASHFGEEIRVDPDVTRLSRQAIEQRLQLSAARNEAPAALARSVDLLLPVLNQRLDRIAVEARAAAAQRGAARFQAGMGQMAQQRLTEVTRIASNQTSSSAEIARRAADGLTAQVAATGGLVAYAEDRLLSLDQAVAEFGTVVARALLALSKADGSALADLANARDIGVGAGDPGRT
jgi:hypothetical protein